MHQDYITRGRGIFYHLQRYSVDRFRLVAKASDTLRRVTRRAQISDIRMALQRLAHLRASIAFGGRMLRKPFVQESMRSADDVRATATRSDVGQHCMYQHAARRR